MNWGNAVLLSRSSTRVWLLLSLLTTLSWWLADSPVSESGLEWLGVALLAIAFFKVRLVILHFMEVREAILPLRLAMELWVLVVGTAVVGFYSATIEVV